MEPAKIRERAENGDFDDEYAKFLINRSDSSRIICDGDSLLIAMEDGYLFDEFVKYLESIL